MNRFHRLLATAVCLSALSMLGACGKSKSVAKDLTVADGFFYFTQPAGVEFECKKQRAANGVEGYACQGQTSATRFVTASAKLPAELEDDKLKDAFGVAMSNAAAQLDSSIAYSKDLEMYGIKGKDFRLRTLRGNALGRIFIGNGYSVMSLAVPRPGEAESDEMTTFVSSLRPITPKK